VNTREAKAASWSFSIDANIFFCKKLSILESILHNNWTSTEKKIYHGLINFFNLYRLKKKE